MVLAEPHVKQFDWSEWVERNSEVFKALTKPERQTTQDFEDKDTYPSRGWDRWFFTTGGRADLLPPWGTKSRDYHLRQYWRSPYNWLGQGAITNAAKSIASIPYEIKGGKILTKRYQDFFAKAHFGDYGGGWHGFIKRTLLDYFTQDFGAVWEIIGPGNPMSPLTGAPTGIAHLDALRCDATGNPEYPVVYWSRKTNKMHRLHRTRVVRLVDMPDTDEAYYGLGLCALSRMVSLIDAQIKMSKYVSQRLDDLPPAGFLTLSGITDRQWQDAKALYEADRSRDGSDIWANTMILRAPDAAIKLEANLIGFSDAPEHFSYREYVEIHVNAIALALGVDPQDIWPLTGAPLGTGTQSEVLHKKATGKSFGDILTLIERIVNFYILPESLEFTFKHEDSVADKEQAENAKAHTEVAKTLKELHSKEIALRYLADNVESFADILLDESGELIELPDDDPKDDTQIQPPPIPESTTAEDGTPLSAATDNQQTDVTADGDNPLAANLGRREYDGLGSKSLQAVRLDFEGDVEDTIAAARNGSLTKRRFSTIMRAHINKYGRDAFDEGLKEGGVEGGADDDDLGTIAKLVATQTSLVASLADAVYAEGGISDAEAANKPAMWWNKSINPFYQEGLVSADRNGMYEWVYGDTEHCGDCKRLNGQRHRLKDWYRNGWLPQASRLECKGYNCKCTLKKTTGSASGRF